jgi:hypothetical protein
LLNTVSLIHTKIILHDKSLAKKVGEKNAIRGRLEAVSSEVRKTRLFAEV